MTIQTRLRSINSIYHEIHKTKASKKYTNKRINGSFAFSLYTSTEIHTFPCISHRNRVPKMQLRLLFLLFYFPLFFFFFLPLLAVFFFTFPRHCPNWLCITVIKNKESEMRKLKVRELQV